jgi:hypothetical protein
MRGNGSSGRSGGWSQMGTLILLKTSVRLAKPRLLYKNAAHKKAAA